jgi:hypothetical protein
MRAPVRRDGFTGSRVSIRTALLYAFFQLCLAGFSAHTFGTRVATSMAVIRRLYQTGGTFSRRFD